MEYDHLSLELLEAHLRGELPPGLFDQLILRHLGERCSTCRSTLEQWLRQRRPVRDGQLLFAIGALVEQLKTREAEVDRRWSTALRELKLLRELEPEARRQKVLKARTRMRGLELAELMLNESRAALPADSENSELWARLASYLVWLAPEDDARRRSLMLRATALEANGLRLRGRRPKAAQTFEQLRDLRRRAGPIDPESEAEICDLEASLWKDLRQFPRAHALLVRARSLYGQLGDRKQELTTTVKLAEVEREGGSPKQAIATLTTLFPELSRAGATAPRLQLYVRHNLVFALCEAGRPRAATTELERTEPLYERFADSWTQIRRLWAAGKIEVALGRHAAAERTFRTVSAAFHDHGSTYDAALAQKDLAMALRAQSKLSELEPLTRQLTTSLISEGMSPQAVADLVPPMPKSG